LVVVQEAPDFI